MDPLACASDLSHLHDCPTAATHGLQMLLSNPTLLNQYIGNRPKMVCFKSFSSFIGKPGYFLHPLQCTAATLFRQRMPPWLNFTESLVALLSFLNISIISIAGFNLTVL